MSRYTVHVSNKEVAERYREAVTKKVGNEFRVALIDIESELSVDSDTKGWTAKRFFTYEIRAIEKYPICAIYVTYHHTQRVVISRLYVGPPPAWVVYNKPKPP